MRAVVAAGLLVYPYCPSSSSPSSSLWQMPITVFAITSCCSNSVDSDVAIIHLASTDENELFLSCQSLFCQVQRLRSFQLWILLFLLCIACHNINKEGTWLSIFKIIFCFVLRNLWTMFTVHCIAPGQTEPFLQLSWPLLSEFVLQNCHPILLLIHFKLVGKVSIFLQPCAALKTSRWVKWPYTVCDRLWEQDRPIRTHLPMRREWSC